MQWKLNYAYDLRTAAQKCETAAEMLVKGTTDYETILELLDIAKLLIQRTSTRVRSENDFI